MFARPILWQITLPNGTDVRAADVLTVNGKGTFMVTQAISGRTYNASVIAYAVQSSLSDTSIPLFTNYTVSFKQAATGIKLTNQKVFIFEMSENIVLDGGLPNYDWGVFFDNRPNYPGTSGVISAGDEILWSPLGTTTSGNVRGKPISKPRVRPENPLLSVAYFKESP